MRVVTTCTLLEIDGIQALCGDGKVIGTLFSDNLFIKLFGLLEVLFCIVELCFREDRSALLREVLHADSVAVGSIGVVGIEGNHL